MKKIIILGTVLLLLAGCQETGRTKPQEFVRLVVPKAQIFTSIQIISQLPSGSWEEPSHESAWTLEPYPQVYYFHRATLGFRLDQLRTGDIIYLFRDWAMETKPLQLRVEVLQIIDAEEEAEVWGQVGGEVFALLTCHPPEDETASQRLVVWVRVDLGPPLAYVDRGDTLQTIANRYGVSPKAILRANDLATPEAVRPEQWLRIPKKKRVLNLWR